MNLGSRLAVGLAANTRALLAKPYSQLLVATDFGGWSLDEDARELIAMAGSLGHTAYRAYRPLQALQQCVHYCSFFSLEDPRVFAGHHRISVDYYHGKPEQDPAFRAVFEAMRKNASRLNRVRLSCSGMLPVARSAGIPEENIHLIPIGINPRYFRRQTPETKKLERERLGIPQSAAVVGSFQKDGVGWGEGLEPKWVKGPDVLLSTLTQLRQKVPELFVLLTGPARGFVKAGLEKAGIPYSHFQATEFSELGDFYQALDCYLVASREEGGPKAVLESMVSGIPLISTKVGQAVDLVRHEENGMLAEVEDTDALVHFTERVLKESGLKNRLVQEGLKTAALQSFEAQRPQWEKYFRGYVDS